MTHASAGQRITSPAACTRTAAGSEAILRSPRNANESDLQQALEDSGFSDVRAYDAERDLGLVGEAGWKFFLGQK